MAKALLIEPIHPVLLQHLEQWGYEYTLVKAITKEHALSMLPEYTGLITSNKLYVDKELIDAGAQLKWIGRMGSGMEIIDVAYAESKQIACISSPEGNANSVAEQALGMLLSLMHNVVKSHLQLQQGIWQRDENRGVELYGKTVGIVGYGNNGSVFARKLLALGCRVLIYDPYKIVLPTDHVTQCTSYEELLQQVDVLSLHIPLNDSTHHFFNETTLSLLGKPIYFVNLSRGGVVQLDAVVNGLKSGKIKGCAIDVWEEEPIINSENKDAASFQFLANHPHAIVTSHIGGYSEEATYKMSFYVAQKLSKLFYNKEEK